MLYCRFCQDLNVLRKNFWDSFPEKLPSEVSITNLVLNWDKSQLSWNNIDVVSCILPNKANEIAILNSRFIQRPIEHWDSVHKDLVRCGVFLFASVFTYWAMRFCPQGPGDIVLFWLASVFECDVSS